MSTAATAAAPSHAPSLPATADDVIDLTDFHQRSGPDLLAKVDAFWEKFAHVEARGLYLWKHHLGSASDRTSRVFTDGEPGREMLLLSSNNYLGLTTHPRVVAAHCDAAVRYGTGAGSAPLLAGTYAPHRRLEARLAALKDAEDACLFSSGYAANLGVIAALCRASDAVYVDRLAHASIIDGARGCGARLHTFRHNDAAHLDERLGSDRRGGGKLVVVDGVYSMDGDIAPLPALLEVTRRHGALLLVDEAHSTGVLGARGRGIAEHFGAAAHDFLVVGTMSKALASAGGFFAGPRKVVEYVRHYARSAMFSTALPPSAAATALAALDVIADEPERVARVQENGRCLRDRLAAAGLRVGPTASPIVPVIVGDEPVLLAMARELHDRAVHVNCIFHPAVAHHDCRLRLSVTSSHTPHDLDRAVEEVVAAARRYGVLPARPLRSASAGCGAQNIRAESECRAVKP